MSEQIVCYEIKGNNVELFCRNALGEHVVKSVSLPAVWVWNAECGKPPGKMPKPYSTRHVTGRGLYACDNASHFTEYTFEKYTPRTKEAGWYNCTLDRYHAHCVVRGVPPSGNTGKPAKVPLMCVDIEACPGPNMEFPSASRDPVLQIAAVVDSDVFSPCNKTKMHIFALGQLAPTLPKLDEFDPADVKAHAYETEQEMLLAFAKFTRKVNPDIVSGWNINGFDLPYLHDRHETLFQDPPKYGKNNCNLRSYTKKNGVRSFFMHGRVVVDLLDVWRKEHTERSYKLVEIAKKYLDATKAPVEYNEIRQLQLTTQGRSKMATYCVKDAWLVWKLSKSRKKWTNALEMSNVTFVPLQHVFTRGQQWKVYSLIARHASQASPTVFIPTEPPASNSGYEGAVVIDPVPGFYTSCVSTVDFASLYPSIMIAFNMCYTNRRCCVTPFEMARSLGLPEKAAKVILGYVGPAHGSMLRAIPADAREYHRCGNADFSKKTTGLLPSILKTLLLNRKRAKKELSRAETDLDRNILNGKQLALKLCANSLYGFTGTSMALGMLPCPDIASSVTHMGRKLIVSTKRKCEARFGVQGVYGDTDSVFFHHANITNVSEASDMAREMATYMNTMFPKPIELEFEKVYAPFLLMAKKRYVGNKFDEGKSPPVIDAKGVEMIRRDNFPLLPRTMQECVQSLMRNNVEEALQRVSDVMQYIRTEANLDVSVFTISKELTKPVTEYSAMPPHVVVASRVPHDVHERVQYIVSNAYGSIGDKAAHPSEMRSKSVDRPWYAAQLQRSMRRILKHCCSDERMTRAFSAGQENEIMSTGHEPILLSLGASTDTVVRRKRKPALITQTKQKRQMTLAQFL